MRQGNEGIGPLKEVDCFVVNLLVDTKNRKVEVVGVIWAVDKDISLASVLHSYVSNCWISKRI